MKSIFGKKILASGNGMKKMSGNNKKMIAGILAASIMASALSGCAATDGYGLGEGEPEGGVVIAADGGSTVSPDDPLLAGLGQNNDLLNAGKKDDEEIAQMPDDYEYSIDENGFFYIENVPEAIDDNYRNYYEIFVMSFYDSDGDGMGDIAGVTKKLDYIKAMGFNGIWLMPVMEAPSYHKYDTDDYYKIDPAYGTNEDFQVLLEEAHKRDINVIIDLVVNHSSSEHPWFKEACEYLATLEEGEEPDAGECKYVDYYHFSRTRGSGYCLVKDTDWYYEAVFNYTQPDLNLESEAVRGELEDIIEFWVGMGVDGFRVDAAAHFDETDHDFNREVLSFIYEKGLSLNDDFYLVSEVWMDEANVAKYYSSKTPSFFNFDSADNSGKIVRTAKGVSSAQGFVNAMEKYQKDYSTMNAAYVDAVFITNHDMTRVANQLTNSINEMKMACGLMMIMQGSTFVYYGEEIGMKSRGTGDENKRIPFVWSESDLAGMTNGPEAADKDIISDFAACDEQMKDPDSILNYYRRAIAFRNGFPSIARGTMKNIYGDDNVGMLEKNYGDETILIVFNTGKAERVCDIPAEYADWNIAGMLTIHPWEEISYDGSGKMTLPARGIVVLKK